MTNAIRQIQNGDSPWKVAKDSLRAKGDNSITGSDIINEMKRLSDLNGCSNVQDFQKKYFSKSGNTVKLFEAKKANNSLKMDTITFSKINKEFSKRDTAVKDNTYSDTIRSKTEIMKESKLWKQSQEIDKINSIKDNKSRVIEFNKKHAKGNYVIVDKNKCTVTVYNKAGKPVKTYEALIGATKGDSLSRAFAADKNVARKGYTTVPGQFEISSKSNNLNGAFFLGNSGETDDPDVQQRHDLPGSKGKKKLTTSFQAIHKTADAENRNRFYNNGKLSDNRQSMGCVNIPGKAFEEMANKYGIKKGSMVYILPEEQGNELRLQIRNGQTKFVTHYRDNSQNKKISKIEERQRAVELAHRRKPAPKQIPAVCWYKPTTWFN